MRITPRPRWRGGRRRSRPSTTRRCVTSSCICIVCSIRKQPRKTHIKASDQPHMLSSRRIARSPVVQRLIGLSAAEYLRLVWSTCRLTIEPADLYEAVEPHQPVIVAIWHGQHFMVPFLSRGHRVKVLISRHRDGEINAYAAELLAIGTVRGAGYHRRRFHLQ